MNEIARNVSAASTASSQGHARQYLTFLVGQEIFAIILKRLLK